jgi:hypothetical protein
MLAPTEGGRVRDFDLSMIKPSHYDDDGQTGVAA